MEFKVTALEAHAGFSSTEILKTTKLPWSIAMSITRLNKKLKPESEALLETLRALESEYRTEKSKVLNNKGEEVDGIRVPSEKVNEFNGKYKEIINTEITINADPVVFTKEFQKTLEHEGIVAEQFEGLLPFMKLE